MTDRSTATARMASLDQLIIEVIANFIQPVPCRETLRDWFDAAGIPSFKANQTAKRGGGPRYYSVSHVEKFFRGRTITKICTRGN